MNTLLRYTPYLLSFIYILITTTSILFLSVDDSIKNSDVNSLGFLGVITTVISIILSYILLKDYKQLRSLIVRNKVLFILITLFVISCLWSENRWVSIRKLKNFIGLIIAIMVIIKDNKNRVWSFLFYYIVISSILSYFFIFIMSEYGWMAYEGNMLPKGIFGHKNILGIFGAFGCLISHYTYSKKKKYYYIIVLIACLGLLLFSKSVTALLALLLSYAIYYMVVSVSGRIWVLMAGISLVTLLFLLNTFVQYDIISSMFGHLGKDMTLTGRSILWGVLIDIGLKKPVFGYGYGSFFRGEETAWLTNLMGWDASHAHNGFLQVFLESGLVGLALVICFITSFTKRLFLYKNPLLYSFLVIFIVFNYSEAGLFNTSFVSVVTLSLYFYLEKETNV